jgi:uridine kinase
MPKPTIYIIAGCNGAGKTTFAKEFRWNFKQITLLLAC